MSLAILLDWGMSLRLHLTYECKILQAATSLKYPPFTFFPDSLPPFITDRAFQPLQLIYPICTDFAALDCEISPVKVFNPNTTQDYLIKLFKIHLSLYKLLDIDNWSLSIIYRQVFPSFEVPLLHVGDLDLLILIWFCFFQLSICYLNHLETLRYLSSQLCRY